MSKLKGRLKDLIKSQPIKNLREETLEVVTHEIKTLAENEKKEFSEIVNKKKGDEAGWDAVISGAIGGGSALLVKSGANALGVNEPEIENTASAIVGLLIMKIIGTVIKRVRNRKKFK